MSGTPHLRVVAVAQAFKETLSASEVASALDAGIRAGGGEPVVLIGSDGGDGLAEVLAPHFVQQTQHQVAGPLSEQVVVEVGWLDPKTALIESRLVCGLSLVPPDRRNPLHTSSRGLGELVDQLVHEGAAAIFMGLGGSATMDGGVGMARAWGWGVCDAAGQTLPEGGGSLVRLATLVPGRRPAAQLTGLVDVVNPLTGPSGARQYAAQKGASPEETEQLDRGLQRLAELAGLEGKGDLVTEPGAGAAGGLGFGITYFGGGSLVQGAAWVLDRIRFAEVLAGARLVICGEGAFDETSLKGKLTGAVLARARTAGIPAALLAPRVQGVPPGVLVEAGGGRWTLDEISRRAALVVERALRSGSVGGYL